MPKALGKLKRLSLEEFWGDECAQLSEWLMQGDILDAIGEALACELAPMKGASRIEAPPGGALAMSVCTGEIVLVQGQLEPMSQAHVGRILVDAARVNATAVIWIASEFHPDVRRAWEWLSAQGGEEGIFYAAELELWTIDDSPPALHFTPICGPRSALLPDSVDSAEQQSSVVPEPVEEPVTAPPSTDTADEKRKGSWPSQDSAQSSGAKGRMGRNAKTDDVAVRENFVYAKSS